MIKPIEAGCLAVIKNYHDTVNGKMVNIGSFIGQVANSYNKNRWEISPPVVALYITRQPKKSLTYDLSEEHLLRVDGYTEPSKAEHQEKERVE
jgi:hypothetical protein